ncbi:Uncharacterised protein [Mycobacteroides abscessus subsp. abscessus]|nr:Uncharacterised protein [Mycobacteroides abscessus subsp. abscessus]
MVPLVAPFAFPPNIAKILPALKTGRPQEICSAASGSASASRRSSARPGSSSVNMMGCVPMGTS